MCGIFGYIGKRNNASEIVFKGIKTLEYRGYDSWGLAAIAASDPTNPPAGGPVRPIIIKKRVGKIGEANVDDMPSSSLAIGHTRWATHGGVTQANAHPHLDCSGTIALIHNGIIENYEQLKQSLQRKGVKLNHLAGVNGKHEHIFISETDTEVAAHMIEAYGKTMPFVDAVRKTFLALDGSNAIITITAGTRMIVAVKNGSPLVVGYGKRENFIASDVSALLPHTKQVYFLEDYDMAIITNSRIQIADSRNGKSKKIIPQTLTWDVEETIKGGYESFMLKEMHEQPRIISKISNLKFPASPAGRQIPCLASRQANKSQKSNLKLKTKSGEDIFTLVQKIRSSYGTYLIGCGTASYACMAGTYLFSTIAKRHVNTAIASEFSYHEDFLTPKSLVIALSQSGETMDLIISVKTAKEKGACVAALVNVIGSTLSRLADITIPTLAGPEIGVASTKDMISKLSHLILLAYGLAGNWSEGKRVLTRAASATTHVLSPANTARITSLAKKMKNAITVFVVGRGLSYPTALETALKIKELSYIHAEGLPAGELKHGPIALIEKGTPCIVFAPNDETYGANLAAAMEMKARGGYIIGISAKPHEVYDFYLPVEDVGPATIIPNIVTGQMIAYYLTKQKGFDPDKPRNLAKSVTVK